MKNQPISAPQPQLINHNCAEMMLKKAAQLVLKKDLDFIYNREIPDVQVDVSPAFLFTENQQKQVWHSGVSKATLEADLRKLERNKVYFMRTGTNDGAGHWQVLYFDANQNGWINYSTDKNNYVLTQNDKLTQNGETLLSPFATWGSKAGEYVFLLVEASSQNLIYASNFLYDFRMEGEERAIEKATEQRETLYDEIQANAYHSSTSVKPSAIQEQDPAVKLNHIIEQLIGNIRNQSNGRRTSRNNAWKIELLGDIQRQLKGKTLSPFETREFVNNIYSICDKRRNFLHFWGEPHSVKEFDNLLKKEFPEQHLMPNPLAIKI